MSREYLYKAKRINWRDLPQKEWWVEGDLIHEPYGTVIQYYEDEAKGKGNCGITKGKKRIKVVVDPETVCEYTRLTDENGKNCYCDFCKCIIPEQSVKYSILIERIGYPERIGDNVCLDCYKIISKAMEQCESRGGNNIL